MPKDYHTLPANQLRRVDRSVDDDAWIIDMLRRAPFAALATAADGQPFINTNLFVYDEAVHAIYLHTARVGRTRANVESDARVCLSVSEMGRLLPAERAFDFSVEYAGVAVFGRASLVKDPVEAGRGLQLLCDKYFPHLKPGADYRTPTPDELKRTSVFRIDIDSW
ncbi:MAG: pyridoxamine 5'-phosphate oxidase family protein, partial [Anaerolineae bacterium]|nr:pyridoxamine 5'-phosphate oxidase family protein [Anaerolineae bacterium]